MAPVASITAILPRIASLWNHRYNTPRVALATSMMHFAQRILNLAYLITTGCQSEKLCLMTRRNTQITPSLWHFLYYESFSIWVSELRVKVVTDGIAIDSRGKFYFTVVHLSILCAQGVTVTSQGWYTLTLCSRHFVWPGMQDGGVATVAMISPDACKISIHFSVVSSLNTPWCKTKFQDWETNTLFIRRTTFSRNWTEER